MAPQLVHAQTMTINNFRSKIKVIRLQMDSQIVRIQTKRIQLEIIQLRMILIMMRHRFTMMSTRLRRLRCRNNWKFNLLKSMQLRMDYCLIRIHNNLKINVVISNRRNNKLFSSVLTEKNC